LNVVDDDSIEDAASNSLGGTGTGNGNFITGEAYTINASKTWYVTTTGNDSNSCKTTGSACLTINGAIGKAAAGDTIDVATGTYTVTGAQVALINKSITLSGGWNAAFTTQGGMSTLDGQGARRG